MGFPFLGFGKASLSQEAPEECLGRGRYVPSEHLHGPGSGRRGIRAAAFTSGQGEDAEKGEEETDVHGRASKGALQAERPLIDNKIPPDVKGRTSVEMNCKLK